VRLPIVDNWVYR